MAETLGQALDSVLAQHPDIRSSRALLKASEERVRQARGNYYPTLGIEAVAAESVDRETTAGERDRSTRRADAYLNWNLFRGLADRHGLRMAEAENLAAVAELDEAHEQVARQVAIAYLDVHRLRQRSELARLLLRDSGRLLNTVKRRLDAGKASPADMEQARMSVIEAQYQLGQLEGQLKGAEARYRLLVGHAPVELEDTELMRAVAELDLNSVLSKALADNRQVVAARAYAQARTEEIGVNAGALYPSLTLDLRRRFHSEIDPEPVTDTLKNAQLVFNYQLPLSGASYSRKREATARMEAAQADVDAAVLDIQSTLSQAWSVMDEARHAAPALAERAAAGVKVVAAYDMQFDAGRRGQQDLINIRAEYYRALADVVENRYAQQSGAAQVLGLLGHLKSALTLPFPP